MDILKPYKLSKVRRTKMGSMLTGKIDYTLENDYMFRAVLQQDFWSNQSLSYLCSIFNNLEKGDKYSQVMPAYHIGIVDFSP